MFQERPSYSQPIHLVAVVTVLAWAAIGCGPRPDVSEGGALKPKEVVQEVEPFIGQPRLDIGDSGVVNLTVYQREKRSIPSSHGSLKLSIGDITGNHVLVTIKVSGGPTLVDRADMWRGDKLNLQIESRSYVVTLDRVVNLLTDRDYAVFSIMLAERWQQEAVERLLSDIEKSDLIFIRNGVDHHGPRLARHLREKLSSFRPPNLTVERFIDEVATKSMTTKEAYQVRLADGQTIPLADWLRNKAGIPATRPAGASTDLLHDPSSRGPHGEN